MTPPRRPSRWRDLSATLGVVVQTLTVLVLLALVAWPERHHVLRIPGSATPAEVKPIVIRDDSLSVLLPFLER